MLVIWVWYDSEWKLDHLSLSYIMDVRTQASSFISEFEKYNFFDITCSPSICNHSFFSLTLKDMIEIPRGVKSLHFLFFFINLVSYEDILSILIILSLKSHLQSLFKSPKHPKTRYFISIV